MTVIDTSAFCKFLLREPDWNKIKELFRSHSDLHGVAMLTTETTNVIWKKVILYGGRQDDALIMFNAMEKIIQEHIIYLDPDLMHLKDALQIGMNYKIPVYDSLFLAQAQHYRTSLVTSDKKQAKIAGELGIPVELI